MSANAEKGTFLSLKLLAPDRFVCGKNHCRALVERMAGKMTKSKPDSENFTLGVDFSGFVSSSPGLIFTPTEMFDMSKCGPTCLLSVYFLTLGVHESYLFLQALPRVHFFKNDRFPRKAVLPQAPLTSIFKIWTWFKREKFVHSM